MANTKAKYTPFGDRVNPGVAIIQAANALDVAAAFAVESRDSDALLKVAAMWVDISGRLVYDDDEEGDDVLEGERRPFGFSTTSEIGEEDDEYESDV
ncbi:hypothetical protein SEA_BOOMERJR_75 [Streptomyces phage BoomerJR]|jgi:hypothetical protein|uniref:Uncharacterized protein n=2 Tax=Streptomyces virus Yaboi TaxID=2846408 RepID=A0A411C4G6_9CAUD|nr:hypothetical protein SEA_GENIE2_75 [Streptomyces phage Genie2]QAY12726.1 hypothetical protein SEA_BOOMERJR_75 [Streptomyces phage BoomerJR]UVD39922.1 hypothetical protein SEA_STANIMAL_75 [Streptomyces phage Stanimal]